MKRTIDKILKDDVHNHELSMNYDLLENFIDVQPLNKKTRKVCACRLAYCKRGMLVHHEMIMRDYFCDNFVYDNVQFRTRFRISKRLFLKVVETIGAFNSYFVLQNA